jgi:protein-S-isoprenylcysteine O-methyltransferase Ste14
LKAHISLVFQLPYAFLFWAVYMWVFFIEGLLIRRSIREKLQPQDAGALRIIVFANNSVTIVGIAVSFLPWFVMQWPGISFILGTFMLFIGSVLRRICFRTLGKYFTGAIIVHPDQPVIDKGPYRWVRHPSYLAGVIIYTGIGIALGNWISVAIFFFTPFLVYMRRIHFEEKALLETLGEPYRDYMSRTKRFIPFLV